MGEGSAGFCGIEGHDMAVMSGTVFRGFPLHTAAHCGATFIRLPHRRGEQHAVVLLS